MTHATTKPATFTGWLRFNEHEDEAQYTGYRFTIDGDDATVKTTFAFSEYEDLVPEQHTSRERARQLWADLLASGWYTAFAIDADGKYTEI